MMKGENETFEDGGGEEIEVQGPKSASISGKEENVEEPKKRMFETDLVWRNIILFCLLHVTAAYGCWLAVTESKWQTNLFAVAMYIANAFGITAGAHRLWSHRAYKARLPLRLALCLFNCTAFQNSILEWSRDHRVHHKYSETDADPHNVNRGLFFAHMGWLLCRKHPQVKLKGQQIDMSDLKADPVVAFQHRYYLPLMVVSCFIVPTLVPWWFWGESLSVAYFVCVSLRYVCSLHATWLVNSAAHAIGSRPYDQRISPSENWSVAVAALGEGWHNYHHVFPFDYRAAELGPAHRFNLTTLLIDLCATVGLAYDLKSVDHSTVVKRVLRTGDGSHTQHDQWVEEEADEGKGLAGGDKSK